MIEKMFLCILIVQFLYIIISDYIQNKKIRKCIRQLKDFKKKIFNNEDAIEIISDKEYIAIDQIEEQIKLLGFYLQCPFYPKENKEYVCRFLRCNNKKC